jgi:hypothetical protein
VVSSSLPQVNGVTPVGEEVVFYSEKRIPTGAIVESITGSQSTSENSTFLRIRNDAKWSEICKQSIGFYVGKGVSSRASCRGCLKIFHKDELRVKTKLLLKGMITHYLTEVSFCPSFYCLSIGTSKYNLSTAKVYTFCSMNDLHSSGTASAIQRLYLGG